MFKDAGWSQNNFIAALIFDLFFIYFLSIFLDRKLKQGKIVWINPKIKD